MRSERPAHLQNGSRPAPNHSLSALGLALSDLVEGAGLRRRSSESLRRPAEPSRRSPGGRSDAEVLGDIYQAGAVSRGRRSREGNRGVGQ